MSASKLAVMTAVMACVVGWAGGAAMAQTPPRKTPTLIESGWELYESTNAEPHPSCTMSHFFNGRRSDMVMIMLTIYPETIVMAFNDHTLPTNKKAQVSLVFGGEEPISNNVAFSEHAGAFFFAKTLYQTFLARMSSSGAMNIEFPDWPGTEPIAMRVPSAEMREAWLGCGNALWNK